MEKAKAHYEEMAAGKCAVWYPVVENVSPAVVNTVIDTFYIEGETVYIDCDSVVQAAKGSEPGKSATNMKRVPVKCPPNMTIHRVDSVKTVVTKVNTAEIRAKTLEAERYRSAATTSRTWAIIGWALAGLLAIGLIFSLKSRS